MNSTIKDVAKACGVSIATVSRAFKDHAVIKPETREMILKTAAEMGYSPNFMASALKSTRTRTIGIIVPAIDNSFYIDFLEAMDAELHARGYRILVSFQQEGIDERAALLTLMVSRPEGIITFSSGGRENEDLFRQLAEHTEIVQLFSRAYPEYSFVDIDDREGTRLATEYLIAQGHQKILFTYHSFEKHRVEAFRDTMEKHGIPLGEDNIVPCKYMQNVTDQAELRQQNTEAIKKSIIRLDATAILSIATTAELSWRAVYALKLHIPDDISFIAYDDVGWIRLMDVTAVSHPFREIASITADHLISRIEARTKGEEVTSPALYVTTPFLTLRSTVKEQRKRLYPT